MVEKAVKSFLSIVDNCQGMSVCACSNDAHFLKHLSKEIETRAKFDSLILENVRQIGIDDVRLVGEFLSTPPYEFGIKIILIHEADKMTQEAANALLKIIEEPPLYSTIVLTTTRYSSLLPTIRSRVISFSFNLSKEDYNALLEKLIGEEEMKRFAVKLAQDFDIFVHLWQNPDLNSVNLPQVNELEDFFTDKGRTGEEKLSFYLRLKELCERFCTSTRSEFVSLYTTLINHASGSSLSKFIMELTKTAMLFLEQKKHLDPDTYIFLDEILRSRSMNFNNPLTLLNVMIRVRGAVRGEECWR